MPRAYQLGRRQIAVDRTRARVLEAARALLAGSHGFDAFTIDAVARKARVARMTVYHQFESKARLLEALFDDLAHAGLVEHLRASFGRHDALAALEAFVAAFVAFWASDRDVIRRLRALAHIDPDIERSIVARDVRRRDGLTVLVERLAKQYGGPSARTRSDVIDVLHVLTGFESFDALADPSRTPAEVSMVLARTARRIVGIERSA